MNRAQKEEAVQALHQTFQDNEMIVVTHYSGLSMAEITDLRHKMREAGASFKVTKNRLAQRALKGTRYEQLSEMFAGPTAIATSTDPVAPAKVAYNFAKENEKLVLIGGALGDTLLDVKDVEKLAKLPSLDEVRAQLVALISTPATRMATLSQAPASQLARVIQAYADKGGAA